MEHRDIEMTFLVDFSGPRKSRKPISRSQRWVDWVTVPREAADVGEALQGCESCESVVF